MTTPETLIAAAAGAFRKPFGAILEIAPDGAPAFYIDGRADPCAVIAVRPDGALPECVWRASADTLARIFQGGRALESAYLSGRLKISGDMSVMARLIMESSP